MLHPSAELAPDETLSLIRAVSHAVLNDLAVVHLLLDIARDPLAAADPEIGLDAAVARVTKVGAVMQQLGLASRATGPQEPVDVADLLRDAGDLLEVAAGAQITLVIDLPPRTGTVDVDPGGVLLRVLKAVLSTARQVEPGSTLTLRWAAEELGPTVTIEGSGGAATRVRLTEVVLDRGYPGTGTSGQAPVTHVDVREAPDRLGT